MKLYHISQREFTGCDTYDSAIVAANNEDEARNIDPAGGGWRPNWSWCSSPDKVTVRYIGEAASNIVQSGVIISSFNAG